MKRFVAIFDSLLLLALAAFCCLDSWRRSSRLTRQLNSWRFASATVRWGLVVWLGPDFCSLRGGGNRTNEDHSFNRLKTSSGKPYFWPSGPTNADIGVLLS